MKRGIIINFSQNLLFLQNNLAKYQQSNGEVKTFEKTLMILT
jgi:hypothetical protein